MKTPLFVFLGVVESGTDANIKTLKSRLEDSFSNVVEEVKFEIKDELLIVTVKPPRFCFYISFVNNDHKTLCQIGRECLGISNCHGILKRLTNPG